MYKVEIIRRPADAGNPNPSLEVKPYAYIGGKRYGMRFSWGLKAENMALAQRLKRAVEAGAVFEEPVFSTDVHGEKYIGSAHKPGVMLRGRALNVDLRRLGF